MNIHLGIDIGGTALKYGVIDSVGHILLSDRTPTRGPDGETGVIARIVECATKMMAWGENAGHSPVSVGIGAPGTISAHTGMVQPPTPSLTAIIDINLATEVTSATGLPGIVDNDANCAAWGEYQFGAGRGIDNLICVTVGTGIGSGFIVDGKIFSGPSGSGAELGHVTIDYDGPECPCGNRGCLENYSSASAMLICANEEIANHPDDDLAKKAGLHDGSVTIADLFNTAQAGDLRAREIIAFAADRLARGIVNGINLFDPEAVVIGGGVADADNDGFWLGTVRDSIHRHAFSTEGRTLPIGRAALGNDAGFVGAAALGAAKAIDKNL
jgi:glucokinase